MAIQKAAHLQICGESYRNENIIGVMAWRSNQSMAAV